MSPAPRLYAMPAGVPFLDALAAGLWAQAGENVLAFASASVLLPTRRACREFRDAVLRLTAGRPLLLPRVRPLGDVDEDEIALSFPEAEGDLPPGIAELRRKLMLARAVMAREGPDGARSPAQALALAGELARLVDQVATERRSFDALADLVPSDYADHWRETLDFLALVTAEWPAILAAEGAIDPAERRNRLLDALARAWRERPPPGPVIAAGSTGSIPATADLLATIAGLPQGAVIVPGLDRGLDDASWGALDESHPQFMLRLLLEKLGVDRKAVEDWPPAVAALKGRGSASAPARAGLPREVMRPAATTEAWRGLTDLDAVALAGVERMDSAHPQEEAASIALVLREALETAGATAMLVTPDRTLARRVAVELGRYGVDADDSGGQPLLDTPPGVFLRLAAEVVTSGAPPATLLSCLKHPLAAGGLAPAGFRALARRLECAVLRGPRPEAGFDGVLRALAQSRLGRDDGALVAWFGRLAEAQAEFAALAAGDAPPVALLRAHVAWAEALAASDAETGPARLWAGEAGEALAGAIAELADAARDFPTVAGAAYPAFFEACFAGRVVRPAFGRHPRLRILGPLEARLQSADLVVLGGLNEGTWPLEPGADPWMSRPMRKDFGLPAPERRMGQSAHDFVQLLEAPRVVLSRALRAGGVPTVPCRWLLRLDAVLAAAGGETPLRLPEPSVARWRTQLDAGPRLPLPGPPAPRPPVSARPRRLSVTEIETLLRDPYAIYARHVLGLTALDPIDDDPGAAERGQFIHAALARFLDLCRDGVPADGERRLLEIGRHEFRSALDLPGVRAFWWPRFEAIARWFVANERVRRAAAVPVAVEKSGWLEFDAPAGRFRLRARADRIDRLATGGLAVIDYKTGTVPTSAQIKAGLGLQLALEAAIARSSGFGDDAKGEPAALEYWKLSGGDPVAAVTSVPDPAAATAQALDGLQRLIARFDDPATAYLARPRPQYAPRHSDYTHLARVAEWSDEEER